MLQFCEALESRMFLSATPVFHKAAPTPTQVADLQAIATAQMTLADDRAARLTTLATDRAAIPAVRSADQAAISADLGTIVEDRGNPSLELANEDQLRADRAKLLLDVHTDTVTLNTDSITTYRQILTDIRAVTAARLQYQRDVRLHL